VPWGELNATVGGRLQASYDPVGAPCQRSANSAACAAALRSSDDEFWLSSYPNGYLHTGLFGAWNLSTAQGGGYSVAAQSAQDVQATVAFASRHNLRLVVKSTGHDWYARSTAPGALLLWTHRLNEISFDPAFVCQGCGAGAATPAVTVGAGVQFAALYPAAQARGRHVIGGTCDSVGVGGCWLGGCFGTFSRRFGAAALNLLQASVVLANGTLVVASAASHAELFWGLRGGGPGLAGVVVQLTAATHPAPTHVYTGSATFSAPNASAFQPVLEAALALLDAPLQGPAWGGGGYALGQWSISFSSHGYEQSAAAWGAVAAPMLAWCAAHAAQTGCSGEAGGALWNASGWAPGQGFPWLEAHPDREISTALLASFTRYIPLSLRATPAGLAYTASALINATALVPPSAGPTASRGTYYAMHDKGQAGLAPQQAAQFAATSLNPVLRDASALLLGMWNVPSLPTAPQGAATLAALWPRLQSYVVLGQEDALWAPCAAGAAGSEASAAACFQGLLAQRVPLLQAQLQALRASLYGAFPTAHPATGAPFSGSYIAETDFGEEGWAESQWGAGNYARLLALKGLYDPQGLFVCHHVSGCGWGGWGRRGKGWSLLPCLTHCHATHTLYTYPPPPHTVRWKRVLDARWELQGVAATGPPLVS
jgi:FAD/FMN-containing dehydrogenase